MLSITQFAIDKGTKIIIMKIKHVTLSLIDISDMNEIPSEFIEPYLQKFLISRIESVGLGFKTPEEVRQDLKGVEKFASIFCGIHARLATYNKYSEFWNLSDEDMIIICKDVIKHN